MEERAAGFEFSRPFLHRRRARRRDALNASRGRKRCSGPKTSFGGGIQEIGAVAATALTAVLSLVFETNGHNGGPKDQQGLPPSIVLLHQAAAMNHQNRTNHFADHHATPALDPSFPPHPEVDGNYRIDRADLGRDGGFLAGRRRAPRAYAFALIGSIRIAKAGGLSACRPLDMRRRPSEFVAIHLLPSTPRDSIARSAQARHDPSTERHAGAFNRGAKRLQGV